MKALILAAGYGTRLAQSFLDYQGEYKEKLRDLIEGKSKGFVPIAGKPIVEHHLNLLTQVGIPLSQIYIYTNATHYPQYHLWGMHQGISPQNIFNNGINSPEKRNEQTRDMLQAIGAVGSDKPLLLLAYDTLVFDKDGRVASLEPLMDGYRKDNTSRVIVYYKREQAFNHGVVTFNAEKNLTSFREKPQDVAEGWVNASIYLLSPQLLQDMITMKDKFPRIGNPLELVWSSFKAVEVSHRVDIGTIDEVLKEIRGLS